MTCCSCCNGKITLESITDPVVKKEIMEIQNQLNMAILNGLNVLKVSNTFMTDKNYGKVVDIEEKLDEETAARIQGDKDLADALEAERQARQEAIEEKFADIQALIDNEAKIREEEDGKLQEQINGLSTDIDSKINEMIAEAIKPLSERIDDLEKELKKAEFDCEDAWKREQARAITVEENLQAQIYLINGKEPPVKNPDDEDGDDDETGKSEPVEPGQPSNPAEGEWDS